MLEPQSGFPLSMRFIMRYISFQYAEAAKFSIQVFQNHIKIRSIFSNVLFPLEISISSLFIKRTNHESDSYLSCDMYL
jgi:hypothetical protein